ncbi:MAG: VOC family protein [Alphaproteobacteria bacterium]
MKLYRVIVPVADIEKAAAFYGQILDMPGERVSPGRHYFDCGGTVLACYDPVADGDGGEARPLPDHIYLSTDDIEGAFEACREAGAIFPETEVQGAGHLGRIETRPWGERCFYAEDPFGNPLCFVDSGTVFTGS